MGMGRPAERPRAVSVMSSRRAASRGVVEEQFVEVAHAVEQQDIRELGLDTEVLPDHRGVGGGVHFFFRVMRVNAGSSMWKSTRLQRVSPVQQTGSWKSDYCKPALKMTWDMTLSSIFFMATVALLTVRIYSIAKS